MLCHGYAILFFFFFALPLPHPDNNPRSQDKNNVAAKKRRYRAYIHTYIGEDRMVKSLVLSAPPDQIRLGGVVAAHGKVGSKNEGLSLE
ncbi:hypothetical protein F5X96DRAFT_648319 [Biscogniauxia mediterranea]|nr:hypothetical protein F5X96DRAFT_648319 [Biscogniauxia mediterranea]